VHHILWEGHLWGAQVGVHPKWNKPAFTPGPQNVTSLWLVLISRPNEGRKVSWPGWLGKILAVYPPKDGHPLSWRWGIELATIESQVRHPNQKTEPLLYRKYCSSQFAVQLYSLVTNWTRKPRKGDAVIAASMHGFASCRKFKSPVTLTLTLDRVKVTSAYTVHVGLPAGPTTWL